MIRFRNDLTFEFVSSLLSYDPETGAFAWKHKPGVRVGTVGKDGYLHINLRGTPRRAHRLACLLMTGEWPTGEIDHCNLVRGDNAWVNLRDTTHAQNQQNSPLRSDNKSGAKGVSFCKFTGRWRVLLYWDGNRVDGGRFDTVPEAAKARDQLAREYHGEFARAA